MLVADGSWQRQPMMGESTVEGDSGGRRWGHLSTEVANGRGGRRPGRKAGGFVEDVYDGGDEDVLSSLRSKPVLKLPVCQFQLKETFYLWHDGINSDVVKKIVITSTSG